MNDLTWTWVAGIDANANIIYHGIYGEQNSPSTNNFPGARYSPTGWYDSSTQELWVFGGYGYGEVQFDGGAFCWHPPKLPHLIFDNRLSK